MDAAQFQQLMQQMQQGLAPLAAPPQPFPAGAFALTPGQANPANPIDYTTSSGIKVWIESTAPLTFKFSALGKEVNTFCEQLMRRAVKQGWNLAPANIIDIPDGDAENRNVINEYGRLTNENIRTHVTTYIATNTRQSQNNVQMFECVMNSLSREGQLTILAEQDKYYITVANVDYPCGPLLFKLLMQKAVIDTRATASLLRENLSSLDTYMSSIQSNIEDFNKYVKMNYEGLKARGERCDDIMINLFKGYMCASDGEFVRYMKQKKDSYDDGTDMTPEQLMTFALNKYEILSKQDLWNAKTAEQEQIVALTAELGKIKDANLKFAKTLKSGKPGKRDGSKKDNPKGKTKPKGKKSQKDKYAWKRIPPKDGDSKTKTVDGVTYRWCEEHPCWVTHSLDDCKVRQKRLAELASRDSNSNNASANTASYANALSAIITDLENQE